MGFSSANLDDDTTSTAWGDPEEYPEYPKLNSESIDHRLTPATPRVPTTNLTMSTQLPASDPYSILHDRIWRQPHKESEYIRTDIMDVPSESDRSHLEQHGYQILDAGSDHSFLPDRRYDLMVRAEYDAIWKYIDEDLRTRARRFGGTIITGQPGIGKSYAIPYYLVKNLLDGQPIALQTEKNGFFVFVESGVYLIRLTSNTNIYDLQSCLKQLGCEPGMIALVESSEKSPSPAAVFTDSRFPFYVVQVTTPIPSRWTDWAGKRSASVLVMKPWSWSEIFVGGMRFCERSVSASDLSHVFKLYGPTPRVCFDLAGDARRILVYNNDLRRTLEACGGTASSLLEVVRSGGFSESFPSLASALLIVPDTSRSPNITFTSSHVLRQRNPQDWSEILSLLASKKATRQDAKAFRFDLTVLQQISHGSFTHPLETFSLPPAYSESTWLEKVCIGHRTFSIVENQMLSLQHKIYYIHDDHEKAHSYDVILTPWISDEGIPNQFYLWKVVAGDYAPIHVEELDELADALPTPFLPWDKRHTPTRWRLVFIVPKGMKDKFKPQPYLGVGKYEWEAKGFIRQEIMEVDI